jgi:hypothetical protein
MGASPGAAAALTRMNADVDIRPVLPTIGVPTLVIHRRGDRCLHVDEGRYLAEHIPGAHWVELAGEDHLPFVGDPEQILDAVDRFVSELEETPPPPRVLATLLFIRTDAVDPLLATLDDEAQRKIEWYHGRKFARVTDALVGTFDGPARAIHCAKSILATAARLGVRLAAGLHTGECVVEGESLTGSAVEIGALLAEAAAPGEIVVSNTVRDLVSGSGLRFQPRGQTALGDRLGTWDLFEVID